MQEGSGLSPERWQALPAGFEGGMGSVQQHWEHWQAFPAGFQGGMGSSIAPG